MEKKIFEKVGKGLDGLDFKKLEGRLKELMNKMPVASELTKILESLKPIKQRNVKVEDTDCIISLSVDNKVSIQFPTELLADKYYEEFKCQKTTIETQQSEFTKLHADYYFLNSAKNELTEKNLSLYTKLQQKIELYNEKDEMYEKVCTELNKIKSTNWYKLSKLFKRK